MSKNIIIVLIVLLAVGVGVGIYFSQKGAVFEEKEVLMPVKEVTAKSVLEKFLNNLIENDYEAAADLMVDLEGKPYSGKVRAGVISFLSSLGPPASPQISESDIPSIEREKEAIPCLDGKRFTVVSNISDVEGVGKGSMTATYYVVNCEQEWRIYDSGGEAFLEIFGYRKNGISKKTQETRRGWYTSLEMGFEVQIPSGWRSALEWEEENWIYFTPESESESDPVHSLIQVKSCEIPETTLEEYVMWEKTGPITVIGQKLVSENFTHVAGKSAWEIVLEQETQKERRIYLVHNQKRYIIELVTYGDPQKVDSVFTKFEPDFEKFIETFKFTQAEKEKEGSVKITDYFYDPSTNKLKVEVKNTGSVAVTITEISYYYERGGGAMGTERKLEPDQISVFELEPEEVTKIKLIRVEALTPDEYATIIETEW